MSDVRLSNGSPTLERTEPRLSDQQHPKPSACRNLFGSVDHQELRRDLKGHLQEMEEASSAKWSFDFASHRPLTTGRFDWELVDCKDIPNFYHRAQRSSAKGVVVCPTGNTTTSHSRPTTTELDLNGNHHHQSPDMFGSQMDCTKDQCSTGQRKRAACHDPSSQNKRSHTSCDEVSRCPAALTHSVELTPRKSSPKSQT